MEGGEEMTRAQLSEPEMEASVKANPGSGSTTSEPCTLPALRKVGWDRRNSPLGPMKVPLL